MMAELTGAVRTAAMPFNPGDEAITIAPLVGDARIVLLGEATHGTHEFYRARAELTRYLVATAGFNAVAVEGDWPDCHRVSQWLAGRGTDAAAEDALGDFTRFPRWMWRNRDVVWLLDWLRQHNRHRAARDQVGFYGLDLYSLHRSIERVIGYLRGVDPAAAARARSRYGCFDVFGQDPQSYGHIARFDLSRSCREEVIAQLVELRHRAVEYLSRNGLIAADDYFAAEQNARVVKGAEAYYRAMFGSATASWNLRDEHMMATLGAVINHLRSRGSEPRVVVWAHNSHVGDARATRMGREGELNIGQLAREAHRGQVYVIGFTTHTGTVTAATDWDAPAELMRVAPSLEGSYERLFHETRLGTFVLDLHQPAVQALTTPRLERAIGVVYRQQSERRSHYFEASLTRQFDAVVHYDDSRAVEPLERWSRHDVDSPETFPTGV
jgi:erythromycin esterase-like protein